MKGRIAVGVRRSAIVLTIIGGTVPSFGVERDYVDRARLTESEEALVLKMARNRGIEEVAKIRTYNMFPTPFRGIAVHGPDQIEGREVSHRVLSVSYRKWLEPGAKPGKDDLLMEFLGGTGEGSEEDDSSAWKRRIPNRNSEGNFSGSLRVGLGASSRRTLQARACGRGEDDGRSRLVEAAPFWEMERSYLSRLRS